MWRHPRLLTLTAEKSHAIFCQHEKQRKSIILSQAHTLLLSPTLLQGAYLQERAPQIALFAAHCPLRCGCDACIASGCSRNLNFKFVSRAIHPGRRFLPCLATTTPTPTATPAPLHFLHLRKAKRSNKYIHSKGYTTKGRPRTRTRSRPLTTHSLFRTAPFCAGWKRNRISFWSIFAHFATQLGWAALF